MHLVNRLQPKKMLGTDPSWLVRSLNFSKINKLDAAFVCLIFLLRVASTSTANIAYLMLSVYAFLGWPQVVQSYVLSCLLTLINPAIAADVEVAVVSRYLVLFAGFLSVGFRGGFWRITRPLGLTYLLGFFLIVHSAILSQMPLISSLKSLAWFMAASTAIAAVTQMQAHIYRDMANWLYCVFLALVLASIPFMMIPSIGFARNGEGFQGVLNHPQAFGPTVAILGSMVAGALCSRRKVSVGLSATLVVCFVFVILSESRTAGFALILGLSLSAFSFRLVAGRSFFEVAPLLRGWRVVLLLLIALFALTAAGSQLQEVFESYVAKRSETNSLSPVQVYQSSRGALIEEMVSNIVLNPWGGIGFGIASDPTYMFVIYDPFFDLPVSASVEKGVLPVALLEEVGIPGFLLCAIWLWILVQHAARFAMIGLFVTSTALLLNMGESVLFSPGGFGMLVLVMMCFWVFNPNERWANRNTVA